MTCKELSKDVCKGATLGFFLAAPVGAAAGRVGIAQFVYGTSVDGSYFENKNGGVAAGMGALVGAFVGMGMGAVIYPAYKAVVGWCYPRNPNTSFGNDLEMPKGPSEEAKAKAGWT